MEEKLPKGWLSSRVGELCNAFNGRPFKSSEWAKSGFPIIRIQNLNKIDAFFNYYQGNPDQKHLVKNGDLLFAWSGTPGTSFGAHLWNGCDAVLNQHIFKLVFDHSIIDRKFFCYALNQNVSGYIKQAQGGVGLAHITKTKFDDSIIQLPPPNEQKRIVAKIEELFSEIDKGRENLLKAQELLKAYRQSMLKNAFEGKLTEKWREENKDKLKTTDELSTYLRCTRKEHHQKSIEKWESNNATERTSPSPKPRSLKNLNMISATELEDLPALPDAWVWDKLGCMTLGVEYGTSAKSSKHGDVVVLRMGNIQAGTFIWKDLAFTSNKEEIAKYSLKKDDVLFNRTNSPELVGKTALYKGEYPAIFAGYLIRINQIPSVVTSKYLNFYLNSPVAKQYGNRVKTDGVNQSNINGDKLVNYPFPFCSIEEQNVIVSMLEEYLSATDNLEVEIQKDLHRLNALRQSVLKKAFSGELVSQDATDESASILLERITAEKEIPKLPKKTSKQLQKVAI
jgi:type I restriction enzyme, S subunit